MVIKLKHKQLSIRPERLPVHSACRNVVVSWEAVAHSNTHLWESNNALWKPSNGPRLSILLTDFVQNPNKAPQLSLPNNPLKKKKKKKKKKKRKLIVTNSTDVSKEDQHTSPPTTQQQKDDEEKEGKFDKRRLEEKFAVLNTGICECRSCGYKYDEALGDPSYPIPPGLPFEKLPEDWRCTTCGASKGFFESKSVEIAGFAQNQQFGLGANTLTSA